MTNVRPIIVLGAGLAGTEAAWQVASAGIPVTLVEMRPIRRSPAHHSSDFAELVCSNSFGALSSDRAAGLLQEELRRLGSLVIGTADAHAVPAGGALAVDRGRYSAALTEALDQHPLVTIERREQLNLPDADTITYDIFILRPIYLFFRKSISTLFKAQREDSRLLS